jgi:quinol monooxygenase YgiN
MSPAFRACRPDFHRRSRIVPFTASGDEFMTSVALYVELKAKPGKEEEVAAFLAGAQSLAVSEAGTIVWFAARVDKDTFFIFDAFNEEAGRNAHLSGPIAAALMANAEKLLAAAPAIRKADILADKLPA